MVAKRGKKSKAKSDWQQDGGVLPDDAAKERGPRITQDRDERFRRGRLKMAEGKKKRMFAKKMAHKVNFTDVITSSMDSTEHDGDLSTESLKPSRLVRTRSKSSLSVMERFHKFLSANSTTNSGEDDDIVDGDDEEDENEGQDEDSPSSAHNNGIHADDRKSYDGQRADEEDNNTSDNDEDDQEEGDEIDQTAQNDHSTDNALSTSFECFFSTPSNDMKIGKQLHVSDFSGFALYSSWKDIKALKSCNYTTMGDIFGLPKLWKSRASESLSPMSTLLLPHLSTYCDALIDGRNYHCDDDLLRAILLHTCIHVLKARTAVIKHNTKLKQKKNALLIKNNSEKSAKIVQSSLDVPEGVYHDQGFARPRVLILCPFRGVAFRCVKTILETYGENTSVANLEKFVEEYGPPDFDEDSDGNSSNDDAALPADKENSSSGRKKRKRSRKSSERSEDWKADFHQNVDDDFKIGIQINPGHGKGAGADKGVYARLYSDFFISDVIIASPLGLRFIIENGSKESADFLSSIEILILHQADIMYMQNWNHVNYVINHVNKLPAVNNEIDFSRVRPYFLEGNGSKHRQVIFTSHFNEPSIQACFRQHGQSFVGTTRLSKNWKDGVISNVMRRVNQVFQRVQSDEFQSQEDDRFVYFRDAVLGPLLRTNQKRTIIITPSYISFVRVRNELLRQEVNAAFICEYSRESEISRGRSRFFNGTNDILVYSGRFHYFRRYQIRGANHMIFYSLPEYPHFYPELVNMVNDSGEASSASSCLILFTRFDRMGLERVVGKKRSTHLLTSDKSTFMFK